MDWLLLIFLGGIVGITVIYSYRLGISPTPTSPKVKKHLLSMLPKKVDQQIVELGSGWGFLAYALALHFPSSRVVGFEVSPFPYIVSKIIAFCLNLPNLMIQRKNFFQVSLNDVSLVVCYLYPAAMEQLKIKFETELAPGAYVISHTFAVPGWIPIRSERANDLYQTPVFLYQMK